jgi:hypothetical protein
LIGHGKHNVSQSIALIWCGFVHRDLMIDGLTWIYSIIEIQAEFMHRGAEPGRRASPLLSSFAKLAERRTVYVPCHHSFAAPDETGSEAAGGRYGRRQRLPGHDRRQP